jgi:hypothetical protein
LNVDNVKTSFPHVHEVAFVFNMEAGENGHQLEDPVGDLRLRLSGATVMPKKAAGEKSADKKGKGKSTGEDADDKSSSKGLKAATAVNAS